MPNELGRSLIKDAKWFRDLGDKMAEQARDADSARAAKDLMSAAYIAWRRAAELGDSGGDDSDLRRWLDNITGGVLSEQGKEDQ